MTEMSKVNGVDLLLGIYALLTVILKPLPHPGLRQRYLDVEKILSSRPTTPYMANNKP